HLQGTGDRSRHHQLALRLRPARHHGGAEEDARRPHRQDGEVGRLEGDSQAERLGRRVSGRRRVRHVPQGGAGARERGPEIRRAGQVVPTRRLDPAAIVIAALLLVLALVIFWDESRLELSSTYGLGPKAMPIVVASGLVLLAIGTLVMAWTGGMPVPEPAHPMPILAHPGGLAALIALIAMGGGFILATTALFVATSAAFGRRALHVDFAIGFVLATVAYLLFDKLLTLSLPAGPLERLL